MLGILRNLINVPVMEMDGTVISKKAQTLLNPDRMRELMVIPIEVDNKHAQVAFADPLNYDTVEKVKLLANRDVVPVLASLAQIRDVLDLLDVRGYGVRDLSLTDVQRSISNITIQDMNPGNVLKILDDPECTDLHITVGAAPAVRRNGVFERLNMPMVTAELMDSLVAEMIPEEYQEILREEKEVEYTYLRPGSGRYRSNFYYHSGEILTLAAKKLKEDIPSFSDLGLPEVLAGLLGKKGILIVSSDGSHGDSTTIASLVDHINTTQNKNIIIFEDSVEYIHYHKLSNVNQRQIGRDTSRDVDRIFESVFDHDPDVLVFPDIKGRAMLDAIVHAAQKGILVIVGTKAMDTFSSIDQFMAILGDDYVRAQFSRSLLAAFAQRKLPGRKKGTCLIWELLKGSPRIQKYIKDNKVHYIKGQAGTSLQGEYYPMEESAAACVKTGRLDQQILAEDIFISNDMLNVYLGKG